MGLHKARRMVLLTRTALVLEKSNCYAKVQLSIALPLALKDIKFIISNFVHQKISDCFSTVILSNKCE